MWHIYTVGYYSASKRKGILTHAVTRTNLEDISLGEVSWSLWKSIWEFLKGLNVELPYEEMSTETPQTEMQRAKWLKKMEHNLQELWDNHRRCNILIIGIPEREERLEQKKFLKHNDWISPNWCHTSNHRSRKVREYQAGKWFPKNSGDLL